MRRARVRRLMRVRLSQSQRDLVTQELDVMHQVSYSSSVSTFCQNEIKDRNYYKSIQQHIFISFSFSGKRWMAPTYAQCHLCWKFSTAPLNHSREKEGFAKSRPTAQQPGPDFPQFFCPAANPHACTSLHLAWACKIDDSEFEFGYHFNNHLHPLQSFLSLIVVK